MHTLVALPLTIAAVLLVLLCSGCTAHNPLIVRNTTQVVPATEQSYEAHEAPVLVATTSLPASVEYEVLGQVNVGKVWYGRTNSVHEALAEHARRLGADAVIDVQTWHQPSGYAWFAPHGRGTAVRITGGIDRAELQRFGVML